MLNEDPYSLSETFTQLWATLRDATHDPTSEWKTMWLATQQPTQHNSSASSHPQLNHPQLRMVVLREVDITSQILTFFTDPRSPKWQQLEINPLAEVGFWNSTTKVQLRCQCRATLHQEEAFCLPYQTNIPPHLAGDYTSLRPPSQTIPDPTAATELGKDWHFGIIRLHVHSMDCLTLGKEGHRRAKFEKKQSQWSMSWVQP